MTFIYFNTKQQNNEYEKKKVCDSKSEVFGWMLLYSSILFCITFDRGEWGAQVVQMMEEDLV